MQPTWTPHEKHGQLTAQSDLPDSVYAFPKQRKEPLTDASHVRNAVARFDQVTGVSDADRELAFANIEKAAKHYDVDLSETSWHELGVHPQRHRKEAAAKALRRASAGETCKVSGALRNEADDFATPGRARVAGQPVSRIMKNRSRKVSRICLCENQNPCYLSPVAGLRPPGGRRQGRSAEKGAGERFFALGVSINPWKGSFRPRISR